MTCVDGYLICFNDLAILIFSFILVIVCLYILGNPNLLKQIADMFFPLTYDRNNAIGTIRLVIVSFLVISLLVAFRLFLKILN